MGVSFSRVDPIGCDMISGRFVIGFDRGWLTVQCPNLDIVESIGLLDFLCTLFLATGNIRFS